MAKTYKELVVWQLADALRRDVYRLIDASPTAMVDTGFRDQLRDAVSSIPANIAEGFGRFYAREFSRFLMIANGSLKETEERLEDGICRGHFREADLGDVRILLKRETVGLLELMRYLVGPDAKHTAPSSPARAKRKGNP